MMFCGNQLQKHRYQLVGSELNRSRAECTIKQQRNRNRDRNDEQRAFDKAPHDLEAQIRQLADAAEGCDGCDQGQKDDRS